MREIKCRVWDVARKKMYPIGYPTWNGSIETRDGDHTKPTFFLSQNGPEDQGIILQYTGRKDVDNVEIYEGDIVKGSWKGKSIIKEVLGVVEFDESMFCIENKFDGDGYSINRLMVRVIGNIYENPELLKD